MTAKVVPCGNNESGGANATKRVDDCGANKGNTLESTMEYEIYPEDKNLCVTSVLMRS